MSTTFESAVNHHPDDSFCHIALLATESARSGENLIDARYRRLSRSPALSPAGRGISRAENLSLNGLRIEIGICLGAGILIYTSKRMNLPIQPNVKLTNASDYRENYANSVQMRVNIWDFFLVFGTLQQQSETQVDIRNFQGIYLSPQQAKALLGLLQQNVAGYETAFGEIKLDPRMAPHGPVH